VALSPEYEAALAALGRAADAMSRVCNDYQQAAALVVGDETAEVAALREACKQANDAHDEALADTWELIEQEGPS
jgi:hypothetical protein